MLYRMEMDQKRNKRQSTKGGLHTQRKQDQVERKILWYTNMLKIDAEPVTKRSTAAKPKEQPKDASKSTTSTKKKINASEDESGTAKATLPNKYANFTLQTLNKRNQQKKNPKTNWKMTQVRWILLFLII